MSDLNLITFRFADFHLISPIRTALAELLASKIVPIRTKLDFSDIYNKERDQYDAAQILARYEATNPEEYTILLTDVDLYIPIFTFVFGLAKLGGICGIVSSCRLRNEFYGLPAHEGLLKERLTKEIVHELGHLLNLRHCNNLSCVMSSSNSVDDLDIKQARYCEVCLKKITGRSGASSG